MRAVAIHQAEGPYLVPIQNQVLAHDPDRLRRPGFELRHSRDRLPVASKQLTHRCVWPRLAQDPVPFFAKQYPLSYQLDRPWRSEEHTSELQSLRHLVCRLLLEKKKNKNINTQ